MATYALSALLAIAASTPVLAQDNPLPSFPATPLVSLHFAYPSGIPYQAAQPVLRGSQTGYNICNSTTENQQSLCQTAFVNHIDDFCLWAPATPNSTISDTEGEEVAWCTKKGHGTRIIPEGTLQGVQFLVAPDYILVAGFLDQTKVNIAPGDYGGELDPNGQDTNGNPMGGLMYSNSFPTTNTDNNTYAQVNEWNNFMGGNQFCMKVCNNNGPGNNPTGYCQNRLDRLGCLYNAPNNAQNGSFVVCESDDMVPPGIYVVNGVTSSYSQPAETVSITSVPYTPVVPSSSNCVTYQSSALYTDAVNVAAPTSSGSSAPGSKPTSGSGASNTGSGAGPSPTGASSDASSLGVSLFAGIIGVALSVTFLA